VPVPSIVGRGQQAALRGLRAVGSASGLRGASTELAWIAAHIALYPLGVRSERISDGDRHRLDDLAPVHRGLLIGDVDAAGTPILLVHGMVGNRSIFTLLRRALRRRGFGRVHTVNYSPFTRDVRDAARVLGRHVEALCQQTGYERVHVIAHSLGGVIARYYVQRLGGDARVHTLVTLGTPHGGTYAAHLLPVRLARQLRPGSDVLAELATPVHYCRTRFLAVWSNLDQLIYPKQNAQIDHPDLAARNVLLTGAGHMSLPIDRRVVHEVVHALTHLHADGSTATAGVTPIDRAAGDRAGPEPGADRDSTAWPDAAEPGPVPMPRRDRDDGTPGQDSATHSDSSGAGLVPPARRPGRRRAANGDAG
jgi:triacylglycerol lipase